MQREEGKVFWPVHRGRRMLSGSRNGAKLLFDHLGLIRKRVFECRWLNFKKVCYEGESVHVPHDGSINIMGAVNGEFEIAKMENRGDKLTHLCNMSLEEAYRLERNFELLEPMCIVVSNAVWTVT